MIGAIITMDDLPYAVNLAGQVRPLNMGKRKVDIFKTQDIISQFSTMAVNRDIESKRLRDAAACGPKCYYATRIEAAKECEREAVNLRKRIAVIREAVGQ